MEWRHSTEQIGQQMPSSGLVFDNQPLVTASGAHMVCAPWAGNPLVGTAPSRIQPLLHEGETFAQAPMGGESSPCEIDYLELLWTNFHGTCAVEGDPYKQYNMVPGMESVLHDGQARYTVMGIAPSVPHGFADMSFHDQQTETWPAQFSPPASFSSPTLFGQLTSSSHPNVKVPIPRMPNHHPPKQSAFILTPLQSTDILHRYTHR
jgi:hypothetical protein